MTVRLLLILCCLSSSLYALDFSDKLSANILDIYRQQFIRVDRGLEDGIERGDVARLLTTSQAIGKGICTIAEDKYSIWYVYKQYTPFDSIEPLMMYYRGNRPVPIAQRVLVEEDLVVVKSARPEEEKQHMEYIASDAELFSESYGQKIKAKKQDPYFDKKGWKLFAEVAPFSFASDSNEMSYFFDARVQRTGKHNLVAEFGQSAHSFENEYTGEKSRATRSTGLVDYEIKDFYRSGYSYNGAIDYDNKVGESYSPVKHHVIVGALGVKHQLAYHNEYVQSVSVSYIPSFDYLLRDELLQDGSVLTTSETVFRHAMRVSLKARLYEDQVWLYNDGSLMPAQNISDFAFDFSNIYAANRLRFEVKLGKFFGLNYLNDIIYSKHLDVAAANPQLAMRHAITLRFDAAL